MARRRSCGRRDRRHDRRGEATGAVRTFSTPSRRLAPLPAAPGPPRRACGLCGPTRRTASPRRRRAHFKTARESHITGWQFPSAQPGCGLSGTHVKAKPLRARLRRALIHAAVVLRSAATRGRRSNCGLSGRRCLTFLRGSQPSTLLGAQLRLTRTTRSMCGRPTTQMLRVCRSMSVALGYGSSAGV